jgi:ADP-heptose:LPS heptosyltransferase
LLEVDLDLRGKITPRAAAAVLASCSGLVCQVGYLMHAAAAVGTRAVVIYGGFEAPWESGYVQNNNLFTKLPCSPCWLREPCPYNKKCMDQITVDDVFGEVCTLLRSKI